MDENAPPFSSENKMKGGAVMKYQLQRLYTKLLAIYHNSDFCKMMIAVQYNLTSQQVDSILK